MPRVAGFLRVIRRRDRWGRPVDPDYGIDEGELEGGGPDTGFNPDYPDQGFNPDYPDQGGPGGRPGRPERPGHLPGWGRPERPERPERPGRPGNRPPGSWGGRPTDPDYGVDEGGDHIWPFPPGSGLPPVPGQPLPPVDPPPGTIWPPLPPGIDVHGKLLLLAWIPGVGNRWIVVNVPEPPAGGIGGRPPDRPGPTPPGPTPKV